MMWFKHPACNHTLGAPPTRELEVGALPVQVRYDEMMVCTAIDSFWKPDAEELATLVNGGTILLTVYGNQHPVISMGVTP